MERVAIYLRKSRADIEAEARGEGETLAKHKKALMKVAKHQNLNIVNIREEIVSGESLLHRPEMQELLKEVESKKYDAVLVMDVDRLGRGNMQEQGLILETFRQSKTKIITPRKTYDLEDEWDEEYSEFEAFMARKELKLINRRLQGGRVRSIEEGNYIATRPPYGYLIENNGKERYLIPHPDQEHVVKMIFNWYTHSDPQKQMGTRRIANELNNMGIPTYTGRKWMPSSVLTVLKNAVYIGRIQWKKKQYKKSKDPLKKTDRKTRPVDEWIDTKGKHRPIISNEVFLKAQKILKTRYHIPYKLQNGITNPLAGIIRCGLCDSAAVYRPYQNGPGHIRCSNDFCNSKSSRFDYVETRIVSSLTKWLAEYKAQWEKHADEPQESQIDSKQSILQSMLKEKTEVENQKGRLHDFLERGIYDEETYVDRSQNLAIRIENLSEAIERVDKELKIEQVRGTARKEIIPSVEYVLKMYHHSDDPLEKNTLLKSVLEKAVYKKEKWQKNDHFEITLHPKLPQKNTSHV
ncbi:recombinase family protein [Brevibacillus daliensis]|uniref:recombinase family protein n=1 Tax=Brevibacillus daliensis TaxID=2892995 RepID=UPI001E374C98|nr:recombinase family protein [Brevibacillus daliensis]